jgi:TonB family protein
MRAMPIKACVLLAMFLTLAATGLPAQEPAAASSDEVQVTPAEAELHLLKRVPPVYPSLAQTTHIQGLVVLEVTIDESGSTKIRLISGHPMLAPAAIEAVKQWKYKPFERDGKPVTVKTKVEISIPEHIDQDDARREDIFQSTYWPAERAGQRALKKDDYDTAKKNLLVSRAAAEERGDSKWLELAGTISELGSIERDEKNYPEAERLYKESLALHEKHQKPDEAEVGGALQALANVYLAENEPDKAEPLLLRSVTIYKERVATAPAQEEKTTYERHIAFGSFWLVAIATSSNRVDMALAHCKDALQYAEVETPEQRDIITRGCAEVRGKAKDEGSK